MRSKSTSWVWCLWCLALLPLLCSRGSAQIISGEISGLVIDASQAAIPGADVTLINEATRDTRTAATSEIGRFLFSAVPSGTYTVKVSKAAFETFERTGIVLSAMQRLSLGNIELRVGQVTQTISVRAQGEAVQTESADATGLVSGKQLDLLLARGREPMSLLMTLPGVTPLSVSPWGEVGENDQSSSAASVGGQFGSWTPNIGGGRLFWNTVTVDGQASSGPDFPCLSQIAASVDTVAEMKVAMTNYTAEYGRNPGATVSIVTKSGTKDFHGSLYGFKRHEKLNANDFFNNRDGIPKPLYRFTTIGGTIGGPIYIPNKFNSNKEKLFFFYNHEEWRITQPPGLVQLTVPTALEVKGDFSQTLDLEGNLIPIIDPQTGQQFPGNVIPPDRINPNGQALLKVVGQFTPNRLDRNITEGAYNYEYQDSTVMPKRFQGLKLDFVATSKDRFSLSTRRWWADTRNYSQGYSPLPLLKHHYLFSTDNALLTWTRIISPNIVNEFNIGPEGEKERGVAPGPYPERAHDYFKSVQRTTYDYALGQFYPQANQFDLIPQATWGGVPNEPDIWHDARLPMDQGYTRFSFSDRLSMVRGAHTLKFGADFEQNWAHEGRSGDPADGRFAFDRDPHNPGDANWPFATALLGNFDSYIEANDRPRYRFKRNSLEWFAQDTWKLTRKLTLNYGLRFAYFGNWYMALGRGVAWVPERYDPSQVPPLYQPALDANGNRVAQDPRTGALFPEPYIGAFVPGVGDPFTGMVWTDDKSYPKSFMEQKPVQVAPRFGFAYDVFGDGKTALRGGFGVMKETQPGYELSSTNQAHNPPAQLTPQVFYGNMNTFLTSTGLLFPGSTGTLEKAYKVPSVYNFSLGIQRDIGFNTVLDVSYVGNVGRHLMQTVNLNQIPYGARFLPQNQDPTTGEALPTTFLRPFPGYESITRVENSGISNYNALQVSVNRRFTRGVQFGLSYTWSKTMNTGSGEGDELPRYLPWRVWTYGPALFDETHILVVNYIWDLPKASKHVSSPGGQFVVRHLLDNWQLSGVSTFASGFPKAIWYGTTDGADITGGGDGERVLVVARPQLSHGERTFDRWFNTEAFARPPQGSYGNASVFPIRGPGVNNWDITLLKNIPLKSEARYLQFRLEMYNAFNHTQFSDVDTFAYFNPAGDQVNGRFGQVTATRFPRVIQLALKLVF